MERPCLEEKIPFRSSFYFNLSFTYEALKVMFGRVKHVKKGIFLILFHQKVIESHAVKPRAWFLIVWYRLNAFWCLFTLFEKLFS